jgi:hypothetical protein
MEMQCQNVNRLVSVIQSASTISNIRKSLKRIRIAIQFGDGILWAKVDLSGCKKVCHFTSDIMTPSLDAQAKTGVCILVTGHPSRVEMLALPSALLDLDEDQTLYQFLPEASLESDERRTWSPQESLEQEFAGSINDLVG